MKKTDEKNPTDSEMLDFLEGQGAHYQWKVQLETNYPYIRDCVWIGRNTSSGYKTIREAITASMKEHEEAKAKEKGETK